MTTPLLDIYLFREEMRRQQALIDSMSKKQKERFMEEIENPDPGRTYTFKLSDEIYNELQNRIKQGHDDLDALNN